MNKGFLFGYSELRTLSHGRFYFKNSFSSSSYPLQYFSDYVTVLLPVVHDPAKQPISLSQWFYSS